VPKYMLVLWRPVNVTIEAFRAELTGPRAAAAIAVGPAALTINVADGPRSPISRKRDDGARIGGLVSVTVEDRGAAVAMARGLDAAGAHHAVYAVTEAVPVEYERTWPLGAQSPGLKQVTFLQRRPGMTHAELIAYWHGTHTPLAMEVHPLWRYVRNVVDEVITEGAPRYEGIVELQFRSVEDVTDSTRFYGGKPENMQRIANDVRNFIDFDTIDISHMNELVLV